MRRLFLMRIEYEFTYTNLNRILWIMVFSGFPSALKIMSSFTCISCALCGARFVFLALFTCTKREWRERERANKICHCLYGLWYESFRLYCILWFGWVQLCVFYSLLFIHAKTSSQKICLLYSMFDKIWMKGKMRTKVWLLLFLPFCKIKENR